MSLAITESVWAERKTWRWGGKCKWAESQKSSTARHGAGGDGGRGATHRAKSSSNYKLPLLWCSVEIMINSCKVGSLAITYVVPLASSWSGHRLIVGKKFEEYNYSTLLTFPAKLATSVGLKIMLSIVDTDCWWGQRSTKSVFSDRPSELNVTFQL